MRLRFTRRAVQNLDQISSYLRERSPTGLRSVRDALQKTLDLIAEFPASGRRQEVEGVLKMVTRRYGYVIYYRLDRARAEVQILSVKHGAQAREHRDR
jgi:toxin ParE1/3/4